MRTATTTKDERRGGVVGKRKKGATGFIALPLRSQDHLITFPMQLYLGREFDVSIRIEIGLIPIRTYGTPRKRALFWAFPSCALPWNIGMRCIVLQSSLFVFLFPFYLSSLSRAQEQRRLFWPLPTAGGGVYKSGTPFHCSVVLRLRHTAGHRRAPGPLCVCVGDGYGHQICKKDPMQM